MRRFCLTPCLIFVLSFISSPAFAGSQDFTLVNGSASSICFVYVSPSNSNDWGSDILGAEECLAPGQSVDIAFDAGSQAMWDLRVEDNDSGQEDYLGFNLNAISKVTIKGGGQASYQ